MSALRRAGVWLGLIEDDDEELYDEPEPVVAGRRERDRADRRLRHDDEYGDGHVASRSEVRRGDDPEAPVVPRSRLGERRRDGDDDESRPPARDTTVSYLTREGRPRQA